MVKDLFEELGFDTPRDRWYAERDDDPEVDYDDEDE